MTKLSLRERFARPGRSRGVDLVPSGSPAILSLKIKGALADVRTIDAMVALRRRGASLLKAKRAVEAAVERRANVIVAPTVEDIGALGRELERCGFAASVVETSNVDVKTLRERLELTQEQFADRFGFEVDALRNWEYGRREPDAAARSYLTVIDRAPEAVQKALATPLT
jgi:putative transcriptional regulator